MFTMSRDDRNSEARLRRFRSKQSSDYQHRRSLHCIGSTLRVTHLPFSKTVINIFWVMIPQT